MGEVWIDIEADDSQVQEFFTYAGYHVRDMREPLEESLVFVVLANIEEQFVTEGALAGGWKPLTDEYRMRKEVRWPGKGILEASGGMRDYIMGARGDKPWRITRSYLVYDPHHDPKVEYHQHGAYGRQPGGNLPAREILTWGAHDDLHVEHIFSEWLDKLRDYNFARSGDAPRPDALPHIGMML